MLEDLFCELDGGVDFVLGEERLNVGACGCDCSAAGVGFQGGGAGEAAERAGAFEGPALETCVAVWGGEAKGEV